MLNLRDVSKQYRTRNGRRTVLNNIQLAIGKSERVGILGRNGSGKSTLIRLIGGSELPSSGQIDRGMTVSWPLAFSGGFQGSLTGLDNLRFVCRVYGASYDDALPFVEEFTELGDYLREPVKKYSNGMRARLAFAMSMAIEFECFLIDEVIAVGDASFQAKCHHELFERRRDRAMIMVSHDPQMIREHCSRACVLERGILREFADVDTAFDFYYEATGQSEKRAFVAPPLAPKAVLQLVAAEAPLAQTKPSNHITDLVLPAHQMTKEKQNERIIQAFYRALLGREPEPSGLQHHTELLARHDSESAIEQTLQMFLASEESKSHFKRKVLVAFPDSTANTPRYFDNIVSLGTHCYTSTFLKRFGLKKFSSAFDWTFASPSMIAHAVEDNFQTFLDRQYYAPVPVEERRDGPEVNRVQHVFYQEKHGVDFVFNHHDVHESTDYAYLTRCVDRLRLCLKNGASTLFLMIRREDEHSDHDFDLVQTALKRAAPDCAFVFVAVARGKTKTGVPSVTVSAKDSRSAMYRFSGSSDWQTLQFADSLDEISLFRTIFKDFRPSTV